MPPPRVSPAIPTDPVSPNPVVRPCFAACCGVLAGCEPGLGPRYPPLRVDVQRAHIGHVQDQSPVARAVTSEAVPAAANGELKLFGARERDGERHVGGIGRADDQRGSPVDCGVDD